MASRLVVLIGLVVTACGTSVAPSLTSATLPTETPTQTPTLTPTEAPTQSPTAVASLLIDRPTGPTDVVLRMSVTGGFLYPGTTVDMAPTFTLYGDGRVIYTVERPLPNGALRRELRQAQLSEEQIDALMSNALGPGNLATARDRYTDVPIADATTTNFEIHAGGIDKSVAVYALGDYGEPNPDAAARLAFKSLADALVGFGAEVEASNATDLGAYEPEAYRVTLYPDDFAEIPPSAEWPWADLTPADFEPDNSNFRIAILDAEHGALVAELPVADIGDPVVVGPDGTSYLVRARPLLPDELP